MDFEFDNITDALLQKAARDAVRSRENTTLNHLDADDLAAFAENVLPNNTRLLYASHLAECDDCREILSNLILSQDAEQEEVLDVEPANQVSVSTAISWSDWFKNSFVLPKLGYAAAGLAFLLIGTYAFVIYRETQLSRENTVATIQSVETEKQRTKQITSAAAPSIKEENKPEIIEEPSPSPAENDLAAITAPPPTPAENPADLPPGYRIPKNPNSGNKLVQPEQQSARNEAKEQSSAGNSRATASLSSSEIAGAPAAAPQPKQSTDVTSADLGDKTKAELEAAGALARGASEKRATSEKRDMADSVAQSTQSRRSAPATTLDSGAPKTATASLTQIISGKTFRRQNNVWVDSSYNSQNVTTIARNSNEYQKLDAGLRSIANRLNGEAIVVWQGKAYRIR